MPPVVDASLAHVNQRLLCEVRREESVAPGPRRALEIPGSRARGRCSSQMLTAAPLHLFVQDFLSPCRCAGRGESMHVPTTAHA